MFSGFFLSDFEKFPYFLFEMGPQFQKAKHTLGLIRLINMFQEK